MHWQNMKASKKIQKFSIISAFIVCLVSRIKSAHICSTPDEWMGIYDVENVAAQNFRVSKRTWPNGIVKYHLNSSLSPSDIDEVQAAFEEYHKKTCIRFEAKSPMDINYVNIELDSNPELCGLAEMCMKRGYQYVKIGATCRNKATVIHELGHSLCLKHEHQRADRDDFVTIDSTCMKDNGYIKLDKKHQTRGFYDYFSQMHYSCDFCITPKNKEISGCGDAVTSGLSVLDADYLNELYNCQSCFSHRWINRNDLTPEHKKIMFSFGFYDSSRSPLYPCRGFLNTKLVVGWTIYPEEANECERCYVAVGDVSDIIDDYEVLTIPGGLRNAERVYRLVKVNKSWDKTKLDKIFEHAVVGGNVNVANSSGSGNIYIGYLTDAHFGDSCTHLVSYRSGIPVWCAGERNRSNVIGSVVLNSTGYESSFHTCSDSQPNFQTYYVLICQESSNAEIILWADEVSSESEEDETSINLPVRYSTTISLYESESRIVIFGRVMLDATEFIIDLMENTPKGIIALRLNANFAANEVIRNSYSVRSGWGIEERNNGRDRFPFKPGDRFELEIRCRKGKFRFYVGGVYFGRYRYYQPLSKVNFMRIMGDVEDFSVISQ